jgi:hypothetical protein
LNEEALDHRGLLRLKKKKKMMMMMMKKKKKKLRTPLIT